MIRSLLIRGGFLSILSLAFLATWNSGSANQAPPLRWYKGNLHTHTLNSDGDSTPSDVASWYRDHRYQFLVLSDHNYLTEVDGLNAIHGAKEKFLLIAGEEVTDSFQGKPVHVNAYNLSRFVAPTHGSSLVATIQGNVNAIREARALPSLNHPNFRWAVTSQDLLQVENLPLFEVYNGHPLVHNQGGGGSESLEEMWDVLLSADKRVYGIAVDDAHNFKTMGPKLSNPGRGWVMVRAPELTKEAIAAALSAGNFYASSGVELVDAAATESELRIQIKPESDTRYTTKFIGAGGKVLATSFGTEAAYRFASGEKYVRAKVEASTGDEAWVQPHFR
ncbi:MAG: CehA/McbA family metallohydrolase [Bryobacteraceae bacterium]